MRFVILRQILAAALVFAPAVFAQHGHGGSRGGGSHPGVSSPGSSRPAAPAPPGAGSSRFAGRRAYGGGAVYVPYPVYGFGYGAGYVLDGFYANDYNPAASGYDPGYTDPYSADAAPAPPTVVINQNFQTDSVRPQFRDYSNVPLPQPGIVAVPPGSNRAPTALPDDQPTIFLIAMQDHSIHPVIAYWVLGDTLNYITVEGAPNKVSLALVDRDFSKQLNAERNVPFALPAVR